MIIAPLVHELIPFSATILDPYEVDRSVLALKTGPFRLM